MLRHAFAIEGYNDEQRPPAVRVGCFTAAPPPSFTAATFVGDADMSQRWLLPAHSAPDYTTFSRLMFTVAPGLIAKQRRPLRQLIDVVKQRRDYICLFSYAAAQAPLRCHVICRLP